MHRSPRRALRLVVAAALAMVAVTGCAGQTTDSGVGTFVPGHAAQLTVAVDQVPRPGFWTGTLRRPSGGFEFGLAQALAERFELDGVRLVHVPFARIVRGDLGGADVAISDITPTDERAEHLEFSVPYLLAAPGVLVRNGVEVRDLYDARKLRWAVERGTTLETVIDEQVRPHRRVDRMVSEATAFAELMAGTVDAVLMDLPVALGYAEASSGRLTVAAQLPGRDYLAIALPKGSANRTAIDSALRALSDDGTLDELAETWLGTNFKNGRADDVPVLRTATAR